MDWQGHNSESIVPLIKILRAINVCRKNGIDLQSDEGPPICDAIGSSTLLSPQQCLDAFVHRDPLRASLIDDKQRSDDHGLLRLVC